MEAKWRWILVTAIAPVAWGATYYVTRQFLPSDTPLWGAALRALPAGIVLLALARSLPRRRWWWRSAVLGLLNVGAFFVLVYMSAQWLPTSIAASIMAISPLVLAGLAWPVAGERPSAVVLASGVAGLAGVVLIVSTGAGGGVDLRGVAASIAAMLSSSLGYVLAKRWQGEVGIVASTSWQLLGGGGALLVVAVLSEGRPPVLDGSAWAGLAFVTLIATAAAFLCWFAGLAHLPVGTVGLIGLLNPITGLVLGILIAGEAVAAPQWIGVALVLASIFAGQRTNGRAARASVRTPLPHASESARC